MARKRKTNEFNSIPLQRAVDKLRETGFKRFPSKLGGEWRRVREHKLQGAKVTVHASGRVTIHYRSMEDGKKSE